MAGAHKTPPPARKDRESPAAGSRGVPIGLWMALVAGIALAVDSVSQRPDPGTGH